MEAWPPRRTTHPQDTSTPQTLLTLTYDSQFGNLIQVTGPNPAGPTQQCTQVNYDSAFSQLPVRTTQFRGGCGGIPLTTSRAYDRGLERVTMEVSPSEEVYSAAYDAFGRLQTASAPDAETPLHSDPNPTVTIDYSKFDPPQPPIDPTSPPAPLPAFLVRVLGVNRNVGLEGQPTHASRWKYFDGSGRQLLTVQQSENAGQWVVQGVTAVGSSTGRVTQAWRPFFDSLPNLRSPHAALPARRRGRVVLSGPSDRGHWDDVASLGHPLGPAAGHQLSPLHGIVLVAPQKSGDGAVCGAECAHQQDRLERRLGGRLARVLLRGDHRSFSLWTIVRASWR